MRRAGLIVGALILVLILAVFALRHWPHSKTASRSANVTQGQPASPPAQPANAPRGPIHSQVELLHEILTQGLTPERAKLLFSLVVGPLPGVTVPPGSGNPYDFDGTPAISYIYQVWDSLTEEQRAAAEKLIQRPGHQGNPGSRPPFSPAPTGSFSSLGAARVPVLIPAAYVITGNTEAFDYEQLAIEANGALASLLHVQAIEFFLDVDDDPPEGSEYAHTTSWFGARDLHPQPEIRGSHASRRAIDCHAPRWPRPQKSRGSPSSMSPRIARPVADNSETSRLLTWPDGTVLRVEQLANYAINVQVRPDASRRGTLTGLLGNFDGSPDNDLVGENNTKLGVGRDEINQKLATAWRLTKATSLFDYRPGQSPASFFDPNFPAKDAEAARLTNYSAAEQTCRTHGITDQRLLDDCILDLAVTNSFVFASRYAHAQQVLAARARLFQPPAAAPVPSMFWVDGEILDSKSEPETRFSGKAGDVIWVGYDPDCKGTSKKSSSLVLDLIDPSGKLLRWAGGCDFGRFELPATGTYTLKAIFKQRDDTIRYHIPVRFVRPDRHLQISYGQAVSGNIEQWAAHDVYTWTGKAGDLIVLSGEGCELKVHTIIIDADGHDVLGPSCRAGTYYKLPKDGTYQLIVNGGEWAHGEITGPYHFVFQGGTLAK
jgi:hypothetical protein